MPSDRITRRVDRLLDLSEEAADRQDWTAAAALAREALAFDSSNEDALALIAAAAAMSDGQVPGSPSVPADAPSSQVPESPAQPSSFANGRYQVRRFLGEGGKKRVFLAHDTSLDRDVAFALIKTEGLDDTGRERIVREAQAMGRLGAHPHIVTIFEIGPSFHSGQVTSEEPYVVTELLAGGDVEGELAAVGGPLPLARTLEIAKGAAGSRSPTSGASCTATSSQATSGSRRTASPRLATSGSRSRSTARGSPSTG